MIGVWCEQHEREIVSEFFELFKTPWEFYDSRRKYDVVIASRAVDPDEVDADLLIVFGSLPHPSDEIHSHPVDGVGETLVEGDGAVLPIYGKVLAFPGAEQGILRTVPHGSAVAFERRTASMRVMRCGYDLFTEVGRLLTSGQPATLAHMPTLDRHIDILRVCITRAGLLLVEIPPVPAGHRFIACLTHDVDFVGIRRHRLDHTMWGFVYRSSIGSLRDVLTRRSSWRRLLANLRALVVLPLVYARVARDFWLDFDEYSDLERELGATYFFIPFRGRAGRDVGTSHARRRAAPYDLEEVRPWIESLVSRGFEVGVHGIDAWTSEESGRAELERMASVTGRSDLGVRMHWLAFDEESPARLEQAGFSYDATCGYNETVGFKAGTHQVFKPPVAAHLLELPLHIMDTALFYPRRLHLTEDEAWERSRDVWTSAAALGGVVTVLWHTRSLGPERLWRDFYERLLEALRAEHAWFASARDVVRWFGSRRLVHFERVEVAGDDIRVRLRTESSAPSPGLVVRVYLPALVGVEGCAASRYVDVPWDEGTDKLVEIRPDAAMDSQRRPRGACADARTSPAEDGRPDGTVDV